MVLTGAISRSQKLHLLETLAARPVVADHKLIAGATRQRQHQRRLTSAELVSVGLTYQQGASMKELAAKFDVHRTTVAAALGKLGIPVRMSGLAPADLPAVIRLYEQGWSLVRLGNRFNCDAETVRQTLIKQGVRRRDPNERSVN